MPDREWSSVTVEIQTGDQIDLTPEDVEAFAAVNEVFPGARLVEVKLPWKPRKPVFERKPRRRRRNAKG